MKKLLTLVLSLIIVFCFVGCTKIVIDPENHGWGEEGQGGSESEPSSGGNGGEGAGGSGEQEPLPQVRPTVISSYESDLLANFPIEMDFLKLGDYIAISTNDSIV